MFCLPTRIHKRQSEGVVLDVCVNGSFISIAKQYEASTKTSTATGAGAGAGAGTGNHKGKAAGSGQSGRKGTNKEKSMEDGDSSATKCVVLTWSIPHIEGTHTNTFFLLLFASYSLTL